MYKGGEVVFTLFPSCVSIGGERGGSFYQGATDSMLISVFEFTVWPHHFHICPPNEWPKEVNCDTKEYRKKSESCMGDCSLTVTRWNHFYYLFMFLFLSHWQHVSVDKVPDVDICQLDQTTQNWSISQWNKHTQI